MCVSEAELILNSKILATHFKELCRNYYSPLKKSNLLRNQQTAKINDDIFLFLTRLGRLLQEEKVHADTFKDEIKKVKDLNILRLEIIWYLHVAKLITLTEYIQYHERNENDQILEHISSQVFKNMLEYKPNMSEIRKAMLIDLTKTLFLCSKENISDHKNYFYKIQLKYITTNFQKFYSCEENGEVETYLEISQLMELLHNSELQEDVIKLFLQHILTVLLESFGQSYKSIFKRQEQIKNEVQNKKIYQFFIVISKSLDLNFFIGELQAKLMNSNKDLNWDHMFCFITFIGLTYSNGWSKLKALSNFILDLSFKNLDKKLLSYVFLIARQGCFEKINSFFPSYSQWFGTTFSFESRREINSKIASEFLFDFLKELIPYDSAHYLKVHLNKLPCVPADCHSVLNDFVALVKIQLSDLNVSTELGICENLTDKSAPVFDVENVIKHFQKTNEIISSVFHASMFSKDYYEKKFLVELLKKFEGKKSVRHKLILKLHSLGKIPNSMFKSYKTLEKK